MKFIDLSSIKDRNGAAIEVKEMELKDIAIIGMSAQLPMAEDTDHYWENIMNRVECIREFPEDRREHADKYLRYKRTEMEEFRYLRGSYLEHIDEFDAKQFHLSPKEAKLMDPRQRLFLQHAWNAMEDAGYCVEELKGQRIGVYTGFSDLGGESYFDMLETIDPQLLDIGLSGNLQAIIPSRVSYMMDFKGPGIVVDTACSSSLVSLHLACQALRSKECDSAIVGSVRLHLLPLEEKYKIGIESKDGRTKAFDDSATGTGIGEGAIAIMLKPLEKAKADGDHMYAVIKGSSINQDGNSIGITAPNADAQADVTERAWKDAGIQAEKITYLEAHGTGTLLGDTIEIDGLNKAFSKYTKKKQFCAISSVKNNIGHLYDASGLASVIKCIYALQNQTIPPTINYTVPNQAIEFQNSPVYVNTRAREWKINGDKRCCGISSFGFSGTNCHIVLEETRQEAVSERNGENLYLLVLSGKTEDTLKTLINRYRSKIGDLSLKDPRDICYTAAVGRTHYDYRMAIIFGDYDELDALLKAVENISLGGLNRKHLLYGVKEKDLGNLSFSQQEQAFDLNGILSESLLLQLAESYVRGENIPWKGFYCSSKRQRVRLPVTVFDKKKYWIDIPEFSGDEIFIKYQKRSQTMLPFELHLKGRETEEYTETEIKVGTAVYKVMELNELDIYENFYDFGGDSILVVNMCSELSQLLQVKLTVADIYSNPSIYLLAKYIDTLAEKYWQSAPSEMEKGEEGLNDCDIAVIGMGGRFPSAENLSEYWENLYNGKDCVTDLPASRKEDLKSYLKHLGIEEEKAEFIKGGYLREIANFDYEFFGLSLKEAALMDPVQRLFLETTFETIEEAGYGGSRLAGSNTGVFLGYTEDYYYSYKRFISESDPHLNRIALAGNLTSTIAGRVSYVLDLKGPSVVIDTACSSSLVAVSNAVKSLRNKECSMAIAGGVKIKLVPLYQPEGNVGVESEHFKIRAFDDQADGTVEGEAVCALFLKPLKQAIKDRDNIHAVIKGAAVNQDGTGMGITAPRADTQQKVITEAWKDGGIDPETITYIEAHGTGTKLGDLIEYEALKKAFELQTNKKQFCAISAGKTNFGHLFQASGIASVIKAILSLEHKTLTPLLHFERPNRLINFEDSPLYVNDIRRDWNTEYERRRCGVSSFGLSGTNSHVILEEYLPDGRGESLREGNCIITISGKDKRAMKELAERYKIWLEEHKKVDIFDFAFTVTAGRGHYKERLAFLAENRETILEKLELLSISDWDKDKIEGICYGNATDKPALPMELKEVLEHIKGRTLDEIERKDLEIMCASYTAGVEFDWETLYKGSTILSLPAYPFRRDKCWYQPKPKRVEFDLCEDSSLRNNFESEEDLAQDHAGKADEIGEESRNGAKEENPIMKAFEEVLGVSVSDPEANFFEMGGNSLKATLLASKVYEYLDVLISLSDILSYPTVGDLIAYIEKKSAGESTDRLLKIPKLGTQEYYDLSLKEMDLWLSTQVYEEESALNITWASMLYDFDILNLKKSLEALVKRHTIMRTGIVLKDGMPKHVLRDLSDFGPFFHEVDISGEKSEKESIAEMIQQEVRRQFDFEKDPLVRIVLAKAEENCYVIIFTISHMIADWWTMDVVIKELRELYRAFCRQETPGLPELTINYMDYAVWHKKRMEESVDLKAYWDSVLQSPIPVLHMLTDFERPKVKGQIGRKFLVAMEAEITDPLREIAEYNKGTMFMTFLTGVYTLLYHYSAQNDIIIGTNTSGREHPQLQNQVGYFVNVLPLRLNIQGSDTFTDLFERVKRTVLGALAHQDYPFTAMLEKDGIVRDLSRSPVFDVLVQYLNDPNTEGPLENGARMEAIPYDSFESKYDLVFNFIEKSNQEVLLELEYSNALFKEETIKRLVEKLKRIMRVFSSNPALAVDKLGLTEKPSEINVISRRKR
ncbi:MAG: condensation domain-containing protein [Hungatella sp.]|nr:condensation domain-containing protein [Hungatella sp.]